MDADAADREAKRRWGPLGYAHEGCGKSVGVYMSTDTTKMNPLGTAQTWEKCFEEADRQAWRRSHPYNLRWDHNRLWNRGWDTPGHLYIIAECSTCQARSVRSVQPAMPVTSKEDWRERAAASERRMQDVVARSPAFASCPHRASGTWPDRTSLRLWLDVTLRATTN